MCRAHGIHRSHIASMHCNSIPKSYSSKIFIVPNFNQSHFGRSFGQQGRQSLCASAPISNLNGISKPLIADVTQERRISFRKCAFVAAAIASVVACQFEIESSLSFGSCGTPPNANIYVLREQICIGKWKATCECWPKDLFHLPMHASLDVAPPLHCCIVVDCCCCPFEWLSNQWTFCFNAYHPSDARMFACSPPVSIRPNTTKLNKWPSIWECIHSITDCWPLWGLFKTVAHTNWMTLSKILWVFFCTLFGHRVDPVRDSCFPIEHVIQPTANT